MSILKRNIKDSLGDRYLSYSSLIPKQLSLRLMQIRSVPNDVPLP